MREWFHSWVCFISTVSDLNQDKVLLQHPCKDGYVLWNSCHFQLEYCSLSSWQHIGHINVICVKNKYPDVSLFVQTIKKAEKIVGKIASLGTK